MKNIRSWGSHSIRNPKAIQNQLWSKKQCTPELEWVLACKQDPGKEWCLPCTTGEENIADTFPMMISSLAHGSHHLPWLNGCEIPAPAWGQTVRWVAQTLLLGYWIPVAQGCEMMWYIYCNWWEIFWLCILKQLDPLSSGLKANPPDLVNTRLHHVFPNKYPQGNVVQRTESEEIHIYLDSQKVEIQVQRDFQVRVV